MTLSPAPRPSEPLGRLLTAYDEALAAGVPSDSLPAPLPPGEEEAFQRLQGLLDQLNQLRPRPTEDSVHKLALPAGLTRVGRFELRRCLGSGGFGIVYLALDPHLRREVALKVPRLEALLDPSARRRFLREARAAAGLHHPHLVPVHEAGEAEGVCYLVSAYCDGPNLAAWLRSRTSPVPPRLAAQLVLDLAGAVQYMHEQGIVHRDIKPSNILLAASNGGPDAEAPLTPLLTDFGLAKDLFESSVCAETQSNALVGTTQYMAPEQAEGHVAAIGPHTDVHALGLLLYEILVGRPAFQAESPIDTLRLVATEQPPRPRALRPSVPLDLETICLRCLEKEPWDRYGSARELREELRRFLDGLPIRSRRVSEFEKLRRWCKRNSSVALLSAAVFASVLVGAGAATFFAIRAEANATRAEANAARALEQKQVADQQRNRSEWLVYAQQMALALSQWQNMDVAHAVDLLDRGRLDFRGWEHAYLQGYFHAGQHTLRLHEQPVLCVALSRDGRVLASGDQAGTLHVWDLDRRQVIQTLSTNHPIRSVAIEPGGKQVVTGGEDGALTFWELPTGTRSRRVNDSTSPIRGLRFSRDGKRLASCDGASIALWDTASGHKLQSLHGSTPSCCVAISDDGNYLAGGGRDGTISVWEAATGCRRALLKGHAVAVTALEFFADGARVASGSADQAIKVWDVAQNTCMQTHLGHSEAITSLAVDASGRRILSGSRDGTVRIWDAAGTREPAILRGHVGEVTEVAVSGDGSRIVSGSLDRTIKLWGQPESQEVPTFAAHSDPVLCVALSPDGAQAASGGEDKSIRLWDLQRGRAVHHLRGHAQSVQGLAFSHDGGLLASCDDEGCIRIWDAETGRALRKMTTLGGSLHSVVFSPDGRQLVSAGKDTAMRLWDVPSGQVVRTYPTDGLAINHVVFSPDGQQLAAGTAHSVLFWSVATGRTVGELQGNAAPILRVAFSPDGQRLAGGSADQTVRVWQLSTGRELLKLEGHRGAVTAVAYSRDGSRIFTGSADRTLKIWHASEGLELLSLLSHTAGITDLAIDRAGERVVTGGRDATVRCWLGKGL
jgi:WD40 repeat protein